MKRAVKNVLRTIVGVALLCIAYMVPLWMTGDINCACASWAVCVATLFFGVFAYQ